MTDTANSPDAADPTVTVVIPVRNRPVLLRRTLASLASQHHQSFAVVVADDGSDEPVDEIVATSGLRRSEVVSGPPQGAGFARNAGAARATTTWLTFLDSDDEADPQWLTTMEELGNRSGAQVVFCGARRVPSEGAPSVLRPKSGLHQPPTLFLAGTFMLRTDLFQEVGGYDATLPAAQHTDLGLRLMERLAPAEASTASSDDLLLTFHVSSAGNIRSDADALRRGARVMVDKHGAALPPRARANYHAIAGVNAIRSGESAREARPDFWAALRAEPARPMHWARWLTTLIPGAARRTWIRSSDKS